MRWATISVDGDLTHHEGELDLDAVVGPEGWDRVRLHPDIAASGFVNGCGLLLPEKYPRNITGSCVLIALGAQPMPYAGPVVLTGWDPQNTVLGRSEIVSLPSPGWLTAFHGHVRAALDGRPVPHPPLWAFDICVIADLVRTAEVPGITLLPGDPS